MQLQDNATGQAGGANIAGGAREAKDLDVVEEEVEQNGQDSCEGREWTSRQVVSLSTQELFEDLAKKIFPFGMMSFLVSNIKTRRRRAKLMVCGMFMHMKKWGLKRRRAQKLATLGSFTLALRNGHLRSVKEMLLMAGVFGGAKLSRKKLLNAASSALSEERRVERERVAEDHPSSRASIFSENEKLTGDVSGTIWSRKTHRQSIFSALCKISRQTLQRQKLSSKRRALRRKRSREGWNHHRRG